MNVSEKGRSARSKHVLVVVFFVLGISLQAQDALSDSSQISLLTCSPSDEAVYTLYGHSAIHVRDTGGLDYVFNYGIFDFTKPNFLYRFAKGETDYRLGVSLYSDFLMDYRMRGSEVYEQTLNLDLKEKNELWKALVVNALPKNRVYRYSFFYDNCSTRPAMLIGRYANGHIAYKAYTKQNTYRDAINYCTRFDPWLTFGCDLVLGMPADQKMRLKESFFLPENVKNAFACAQIVRSDKTRRPLVAAASVVIEAVPDDPPVRNVFTPLVCASIVCIVAAGLTVAERRTKKYFKWFDILLFTLAGMAGCVLYFLCFVSVHRGMWPNISVLWLHPFHLIGVLFFSVKKLNRAAYHYYFINFVALFAMSVGWFFIPQHLNIAFIPLIASLFIRSGYGWMRIKENRR